MFFWDPYNFTQPDIAVIRHPVGQSLGIWHNDLTKPNPRANIEQYAQWLIRPDPHGKEARLQNIKSMKYLRIHEGSDIDVDGNGDKECVFHLHKESTGVFKLESKEYPGKYIAVDNEGVKLGEGGPWTRLSFWTRGPAMPFTHPYLFTLKNIVVIEHREFKYVCVKDEHDKDTRGDCEHKDKDIAHWEAEPLEQGTHVKLRNIKNGKYLRIHDQFLGDDVDTQGDGGELCLFKVHVVEAPNHVTLESVKYPGKYIAAENCKIRVGKGSEHCLLTFYRQ